MSFTPTIIVDFDALKKQAAKIECDYYCADKGSPATELHYTLEVGEFVEFKGIKLCFYCPEFTMQNAAFREYLDSLEIEYALEV